MYASPYDFEVFVIGHGEYRQGTYNNGIRAGMAKNLGLPTRMQTRPFNILQRCSARGRKYSFYSACPHSALSEDFARIVLRGGIGLRRIGQVSEPTCAELAGIRFARSR